MKYFSYGVSMVVVESLEYVHYVVYGSMDP